MRRARIIEPPKFNETVFLQTTKDQTVRDALRDAMSEPDMSRRDETVFLMGEEVAEYNGAHKVSQGMLDEFGPAACD